MIKRYNACLLGTVSLDPFDQNLPSRTLEPGNITNSEVVPYCIATLGRGHSYKTAPTADYPSHQHTRSRIDVTCQRVEPQLQYEASTKISLIIPTREIGTYVESLWNAIWAKQIRGLQAASSQRRFNARCMDPMSCGYEVIGSGGSWGRALCLRSWQSSKLVSTLFPRPDAVAQRSADTYRDLEKDLNLQVVLRMGLALQPRRLI